MAKSPEHLAGAPEMAGERLDLRVGELVEVRSEPEILATLDSGGALNSLPFMPEMLEFCGRRMRVFRRADKTCDTLHYSGSRRMYATVHLEGARCTGRAHGGCQAACMLFWKEAWLKRVDASVRVLQPRSRPTGGRAAARADACTRAQLDAAVHKSADEGDAEARFRCQATDLLLASKPLPYWDVRQYWRDVRSGNVSALAVVRAAGFRIFMIMLKVAGYRALIWSYNRLQTWRGGTPFPFVWGTLADTPRATLDLRPGEWVRVKSQQEILKTVNATNRNAGLTFDAEMVRFCGTVQRVAARVERIIDEKSGRMLVMSRDCIILEGAYCRAEYSHGRLFCPRSLYPFWREIWLDRVPSGDRAAPVRKSEP